MTTREIRMKIHEESDLYSEFDPDQNMLSDETIAYFTRSFSQ